MIFFFSALLFCLKNELIYGRLHFAEIVIDVLSMLLARKRGCVVSPNIIILSDMHTHRCASSYPQMLSLISRSGRLSST